MANGARSGPCPGRRISPLFHKCEKRTGTLHGGVPSALYYFNYLLKSTDSRQQYNQEIGMTSRSKFICKTRGICTTRLQKYNKRGKTNCYAVASVGQKRFPLFANFFLSNLNYVDLSD